MTDASEELLTGFQAQKTHDQEERLVSREECGYIYGMSPRSKAPHRKAASQPFEFSEAPKGVLLESWDLETSAALKKKKKKPKQKRNQPARAVETWEENPERLRTPLCVSEPQKFEVPFAEPCKNTKEITSVSTDVLRKDTSMLGVGSELLGAQNLALTPAKGEQMLQTESSSQLGSGAKAGEFVCMEAATHESLKSSRKENLAERNKPESPVLPPAQTSPLETGVSGKLEGHPPKNGETGCAMSKDVEIAPVKSAIPGGTVALESTTSGRGLVEEKLQQPESGGKRERPGEEAAKSPAEVKTRGVSKGKRCPDKSKGRDPIALDPPLKAATGADPYAELSFGGSKESSPVKTEKLDGGSAEVPSVLEMRSDPVKPPSPAGAIDSTKVSFTDVHKEGGSNPPEQPAGAIPRMVSDQPKKRGSDGRSKRAKDSSEQRLFALEDQAKGAEEAKVPSGTGLPAKSTEVGFSTVKEGKTALGSEEVGKKRSGNGQSRRAAERSSLGPPFFLGAENSTGRLSAEMEQNRQTPKQAGGHEKVADTLAIDVIKPQALAAPPLLEKPKGGAASKIDWVDFPSSAYPFISAAPVVDRECPAPPEADSLTKEASMPEKGKVPLEGPTILDASLPLSTSKSKKSSSDGRSKKSGKSPSEQAFHPEATPENKPSRKTDVIKEMDSAHKSPLPPDAPLLQEDQDQARPRPTTKPMEKTEGKGKVDLSTVPKPRECEQGLLADQKTGTAQLEPLCKSKEVSSAESKQGASPEPLLEDTSCVLKTCAPPTEMDAVGQEGNKAGDSPSFSQHQGKGLDHPKKDAQAVGSVDLPLVDRMSKGAEEGKNRKGTSSLEPSLLLGVKAEAHPFLGAKVDDQAKESSSARSRKEARGSGSSAKPAKRSSDGKSKMAATAPEQPVQAKALANEGPLPQGAGLQYTGEETEFVDENRNIKSLPPGHPMLWEENTMRLFGSFALSGTGGLDEAAFRSQGVECPFLEHAGKVAGALRQGQPFPPEILEDASRGDWTSQQEMQDNLVKQPGKEAVREASLWAKAGDEARGKRSKGKGPLSECLVEQNAPPEKEGVLGSILVQDGGTSLDKTQGSGRSFSDLAGKQKMPAAVQNAGEEGSGSVGQETNAPPTECPAPWENEREVAALQALTEVLVGGNAQLGDSEKGPEQKASKCLQSLGSEAGADKALEDIPGEEVAAACEVKDPSQHGLEQDNVTKSTCSPPVKPASKEEASQARDGQGLESEAGQGEELVLQAAADRGDQVARETKKEERAKAPEQIKGYMRPTKSRGLPPPPPPPRSVAQEYGRRRTAKSDALNLHRQERGVCLQLWSTGSNAYYSLCVRPGALA